MLHTDIQQQNRTGFFISYGLNRFSLFCLPFSFSRTKSRTSGTEFYRNLKAGCWWIAPCFQDTDSLHQNCSAEKKKTFSSWFDVFFKYHTESCVLSVLFFSSFFNGYFIRLMRLWRLFWSSIWNFQNHCIRMYFL